MKTLDVASQMIADLEVRRLDLIEKLAVADLNSPGEASTLQVKITIVVEQIAQLKRFMALMAD